MNSGDTSSARTIRLDDSDAGLRLDQALVRHLPDYSRSQIQRWIREGKVKLEQAKVLPRYRVEGNEVLTLTADGEVTTPWQPEPLRLDVTYEDDDLIVIDKAPGLVVHPGAGNAGGTLINGLLHQYPELLNLPRAGLVHRLDKDTSGLLVCARSSRAHLSLTRQLKDRSMGRHYLALVIGEPTGGGSIDLPLGRHSVNRLKRAVRPDGRPAQTDYSIIRRWPGLTLLEVTLKTGRTHQIRVHMAHSGYPLVGDPLYGGAHRYPARCPEAVRSAIEVFGRQALHAAKLRLHHPADQSTIEWNSPLPADFSQLIHVLDSSFQGETT